MRNDVFSYVKIMVISMLALKLFGMLSHSYIFTTKYLLLLVINRITFMVNKVVNDVG